MKIRILLCALAAFATSCTAGFEDTNKDPNNSNFSDLKARNFLEPIIYNGSRTWNNYTWFWCDQIMQYEAFTSTTREEHRYKVGEQDWNAWYTNFLSTWAVNADAMQKAARSEGLQIIEAVAMTLKAYYIANMTDIFGDIPFSEAFLGREGVVEPRFDTQQEVYEKLFAMLDAANDIYASGEAFPADMANLDGMFGGSVEGWRKFNNSFYLRCLMRVSGRSEMGVGAKMAEIVGNPAKYPLIASNADNAAVRYGTTAPYQNYFSETTEQNFNGDRRLARQFIDMTVTQLNTDGTQNLVDPRLNIWAHKNNFNNNARWKGVIGGGALIDEAFKESTNGASQLRYSVLCRSDFPYTMMDHAEVQLILAEAALRGLILGGKAAAKTYYETGVTASIERWAAQQEYAALESDWTSEKAITAAKIAEYLSNPYVEFDASATDAALLEKIGNQKFLALFWNGMEAWHEYRRTGYPALQIGNGTIYNDFILPTRFAYVQSAIGSNPTNAAVAIDRMNGINDMKQPLWWSRQAIETRYYE